MTKIQLSILVLIAASSMESSLFAQTSLSVGNVPGFPGTTVSVPVLLRQPAGAVVAAQLDVAYDAGRVSTGSSVATTRLANHTIKSREIAPGIRRTLVYSLSNANVEGTNGILVQMPFTVSPAETVGSGPLTPGNLILARADGTALTPVNLNSGTIFVRPVNALPDGSVQFFLHSVNGERYAIQATTNFLSWITISTNISSGDFMNLLDSDAATHPHRFYRWELLSP